MKNCTICQAPLGQRNKSGLCSVCWPKNAWKRLREMHPEIDAKRIAGIRLKYASDPEYKQRAGDICRQNAKLPQSVEARRRCATEHRIWERGNAAQPKGSPPRLKAAARLSANRLGWCPPELRADYRRLRRQKFSFDEAQSIILSQHEKNLRERRGRVR